MYKLLLAGLFSVAFVACTATGESEELPPMVNDDLPHVSDKNSTGNEPSSSSAVSSDSLIQDLSEYMEMVDIPAVILSHGNVEFSVKAFSIAKTEVTQGLYREVMGSVAKEDSLGDDYPVFNVSWYDAAQFCNAFSKLVGLDTAYVYDSVDNGGALVNLSVDYGVVSVRLPTEIEWEIAASAGASSTYYWGNDEASKYAYYAQTKGPMMVAQYRPNAYELYDMAGNVAEWVNDWFAALPTVSQTNYTGPVSGKLKGLRGGGWADKAPALASTERDKKDPKYRGQTVGFRIVYSEGF